ncbi:Alpha/Beta hydrolase protein [Xylariales sp. PMI_506]|nr:Alpha/Beta hydrolase protein [Xylariales sp. PMI_506]
MSTSALLSYLQLNIPVYILRLLQYPLLSYICWSESSLHNKIAERRRIKFPSRDDGRTIDAWIYYPKGYDVDGFEANTNQPTPVLVNWHGSGFMIPCLGLDAFFCARVAHDAGIIVIDADYRKAPENPFPAALHDAEDALAWVASQPRRFDLSRVAVSGFSAGGNLALVAASSLRADLEAVSVPAAAAAGGATALPMRIPLVVAFYPPTDLCADVDAASKLVPNPSKHIPPFMHQLIRRVYVPDEAMRKDPRVSPTYATHELFPENVVILTCEYDNLSPEANHLATKLEDGHRKVVNKTLEGVSHGWDKQCKEGTNDWTQREIGYRLAISTLKEAFNL